MIEALRAQLQCSTLSICHPHGLPYVQPVLNLSAGCWTHGWRTAYVARSVPQYTDHYIQHNSSTPSTKTFMFPFQADKQNKYEPPWKSNSLAGFSKSCYWIWLIEKRTVIMWYVWQLLVSNSEYITRCSTMCNGLTHVVRAPWLMACNTSRSMTMSLLWKVATSLVCYLAEGRKKCPLNPILIELK